MNGYQGGTMGNAYPALSLRLLAMVAVLALPVCNTGAQTIRVGSETEYPPFCVVDVQGRPDGFSVELIRASLEAMALEAEFRTGEWSQVMAWLEHGDVEALPLVGRTPEREAIYDFTFPYMTLYGAIVVRDDNKDIETVEDLRGRRVAVMKADNAEEFLRREDRGIGIHTTATFETALRELADGRHDAVVIQRLVALRLIQEMGRGNLRIIGRPVKDFRQDFCFAVRKGDGTTLSLLNEGLALAIADGTFRRLHSKWFAGLELPTGRRMITGGDHHYPPYEFLNENGQPDGFSVELVQAIARQMDLDIEVRLGPWAKMVDALETGAIDAIQGIFYSPERSLKFSFSIPHTFQHYVSVVRAGSRKPPESFKDLAGMRLVAQEGNLINEHLSANGFADQVSVVGTQEDVLRAVLEGRADCGLVMRLSAMDLIKKHQWKQLRLGSHPVLEAEYCIAVAKGNDALLAQFNEGLRLLKDSGEYRRIQEKWLGTMETPLTWRAVLITAAWVAGPLLLIVLTSLLWSSALNHQVQRRTAELRASEFRFRHMNRVLRAIRDLNKLIIREKKRDALIRQACELLVNSRGYVSVLIILTDANGDGGQWAGGGIAAGSEPLKAMLDAGRLPPCCQGLRHDERDALDVRKQEGACTGCPVSEPSSSALSICVRLTHEGIDCGFMAVAIEPDVMVDEEERGLVSEIAGDIAFALHGIQAEELHMETERQRDSLSGQLMQAQKMEAVGRLAGGVAHDFNNLLMGIMGYAEICREQVPPDHPIGESLDEILKNAKKSADLTRQLLAFARRQTVAPVVLDPNDAIAGMLKLLRRLLGENINLAWVPGLDIWPVKMDPSQIDQILANLCVNARDAICGVGRLSIETANVALTTADCRRHADAVPGEYVMLTVSDNGCGMNTDLLEHIFEPFFSTKELCKGTGLGLATVYGIVRQNNGFIHVQSSPGEGTVFQIHLPRSANATVQTDKDRSPMALPRGDETILLAEDEASIRVVTERLLRNLGYTVLVAEGPQEALRIAKVHPGEIHMLLTDVIMPDMSGRDLADQLMRVRPALKILYMSGYTADVIVHHGVLDAGVELLTKPVNRVEMASRIRTMLDA